MVVVPSQTHFIIKLFNLKEIHINKFVWKRDNSPAYALELHLFHTKPTDTVISIQAVTLYQ